MADLVIKLKQQESSLRAIWRDIQIDDADCRDRLFDIRGEYTMLQEIKHVQDELQMLSEVVECQFQTMKQLSGTTGSYTFENYYPKNDTWRAGHLTEKAEARKMLLAKLRDKAQATYQSVYYTLPVEDAFTDQAWVHRFWIFLMPNSIRQTSLRHAPQERLLNRWKSWLERPTPLQRRTAGKVMQSCL